MILAGIAVSASSAYADENESQDQQGQGQEMRQGGGMMRQGGGREGGMRERSGSGSQQRRGGGMIDQYLRTDLTKADMDALKVVLDQQREAMKTLADSLKAGTITQAEFETRAKTLIDAHVVAVSQYVAADKLEAFKTALAARPLTPPKDGQGQGERGDHGRMDNGSGSVSDGGNRPAREIRQAKLLPASIGTKIDAKLTALATDAARAEWLNAVIAKVEALEAKAKSKKAKSLFSELKDLLNEKLDAIDGTSTDVNSLDGLIQ